MGGKEILMSLYSSLERTENRGYRELAGSPFVRVKIGGLRNFLEQLIL